MEKSSKGFTTKIMVMIMALFMVLSLNAVSVNAAPYSYTFPAISGADVPYMPVSPSKLNIIIFGRPTCGNTKGTLDQINKSNYINDKNIKFIYADIDGNDKATITTFSKNYSSAITFCYGDNNDAAWDLMNYSSGSLALPFVVYVNESGEVVKSDTGYQSIKKISQNLSEILGYEPLVTEFDIYTQSSNNYEEARTMFDMINDFRTGSEAWYWNEDNKTKTVCSGLDKLTYDYELEQVAIQRAKELTAFYSHTRPNGEDCFSAYPENVYTACGENIAYGQKDAERVFVAWREDDENYNGQGHRRNMLGENFNVVGVASFIVNGRKCWVQEFGRKNPADINTTPVSYSKDTSKVLIKASEDIINISKPYGISNLNVGIGKSIKKDLQLFYDCEYVPGSRLYLPTTYKVEDTSIISLGADGTIKGLKVGTTKIIATAKTGVKKTGTFAITVNVIPISISGATVSLSGSAYDYTGSSVTPAVTVTMDGKKLVQNTDYTVTYKNNTLPGKATVTVTGKGNYDGNVSKTFTIKKPPMDSNGNSVSKDGKTVIDSSNQVYLVASKVANSSIKSGIKVTDKKTGKYSVTKIVKSGSKVKSGTVQYIAPYSIKKTSATVPKTIKVGGTTFKVTVIKKGAFKGNKKIKKVVISGNVTSIGANAFSGCKNLKSIVIKTNKIKTIGANAFKGINSKAVIKVPGKKLAKYKKLIKKAKAPKKAKIRK